MPTGSGGFVRDQGAWANIPPKKNRKKPIDFSPDAYRSRNMVERFFAGWRSHERHVRLHCRHHRADPGRNVRPVDTEEHPAESTHLQRVVKNSFPIAIVTVSQQLYFH
jgi:hypothetical protein